MTERKSPTAVLHEGPRALTDDVVREIEESDLSAVLNVDIDDVIEYVHKDLKSLPDFTTLYRRYLKQRWDVYDLDFTQDKIDWTEKMTEAERQSFMAIASGFHHGERQVEIELPVFMIGAGEEEKIHIAAQIEDEARHTVFFDRFYREVVGFEGDDIMAILDASFPWVSETFVGPFGLLAYQADEVRRNPYDERARVRYGTNYFLWIEGVLALSVMKVTLSYARWRGFLPAYYTGFTATCATCRTRSARTRR
jgi:ribonucleoside-diphosphate reductase beta chain